MQGQLFSQNFLRSGIAGTPPHQDLDDGKLADFRRALSAIFAGIDGASALNEAQTEQLIIERVLQELGWGDDWLPQVNATGKGREDVPDYLLFAEPQAKASALAEKKDVDRYRHGIAILEAKRWLRPLDRGDSSDALDPGAPSSQMLRYLSRTEVVSDRVIKWGMLTNGAVWRLYWQDARSRSEEFFEIDLAAALGMAGAQADIIDDMPPDDLLRLFYLFFQRAAFLPQTWDGANRSFHAYARNEARRYEERVSSTLGERVFHDIFPALAQALAQGDLQAETQTLTFLSGKRQQYTRAYLEEVREATLILLYRLLFLFYAEDRNLLPVKDARYADYSVRRIREEVRDKTDAGGVWPNKMVALWLRLRQSFDLLDGGEDSIGIPAYNGGLFDRARSPLLARTRVPDAVLAPIIDTLSRRTEDVLKGWINYRDLSVAHLGGIYERLLDYALEHDVQAADKFDLKEINRVIARPASFARKVSGSYYTHDDLVRLVLRESVGLLSRERLQAFQSHLGKLAKKQSLNPGDWDLLDAQDPASQILELKICDPAMGSGHFLVALVDDLADRVLEAIADAQQQVNAMPWAAHLAEAGRPWQSAVLQRIAAIRQSLKANARQHGWAVTDAQLDDRHIVRRMILKKAVFGVDKNPMAVELAKTALWLHTFTVGAPLSFLDHHLKVGDSLHGEKLDAVQNHIAALGMLFQQADLKRLELVAQNLHQIADLTDIDIAEAHLSQQLAVEAEAEIAPIRALLDSWRALRWLIPGWPVDSAKKLAQLGDAQTTALLGEIFAPDRNLVNLFASGHIPGSSQAVIAANQLLTKAQALARRETFFHWQMAFPTVFNGPQGGFDAVIGNPPWDRIKLQEVEWFAERDLTIATQPRAADRKRRIAELQKKKSPLWQDYQEAAERAETNARVLGNGKQGSGDYPLLGGGDVNLYSLFVERAQTLIHDQGIVALITPSGIAADKGAAAFFKSIATTGRLGALFDFENKKYFFPDVDSRFKLCTLVFGGPLRTFEATRCAFYLHSEAELLALEKAGQVLHLSAADFARVNPNTGAAPIFRSQRDADITMRLYRNHPVLVRHGAGRQPDEKAWPVKYTTLFHMTNDSGLFLKADELQGQGWQRAPLNRWTNAQGQQAVPLYEGKMVQMFDHRAADVVVHTENLHRAAQQEAISIVEKTNPARYPTPQFFVEMQETRANPYEWALGFKEITAPTNMRSMIAALMPGVGFGNKLPLLIPTPGDETPQAAARIASLIVANFNTFAFDFVLRQKLQGQTINLFILEQLPVIAPARFDEPLPAAFAAAMRQQGLLSPLTPAPLPASGARGEKPLPPTAGSRGETPPLPTRGERVGVRGKAPAASLPASDFIIEQVLALSYTAHDLAPFARDLGHVDATGQPLPPFIWNDENRRARIAALDALFFHLYGLNVDDAAYVLDTFPIVREQDERTFGRYRSKDDVLALLPLLENP
ncbi:MAG: Eco57I restriction-modification methylase domain-containing protein [Desulfobulbus sp.]|nr:Eco57I restriction-modification methylase domain-containing protein [Desulfobulbus sp.]